MNLPAVRWKIGAWLTAHIRQTRATTRAWASSRLVSLLIETRDNAPTAVHVGEGQSISLYWLQDIEGNAVVVAEAGDTMLLIPSSQAMEVARQIAECAAEADREADQ